MPSRVDIERSFEPLGGGLLLGSISDLDDYRTRNGRPLKELRSKPNTLQAAKKQKVPFNQVVSDYPDSRLGYLINQSALLDMEGRKNSLFSALAYLHYHYYQQPDIPSSQLRQLYELSSIGFVLPSYLVLRADDPLAKTAIPNIVGDVYKACAGMNGVLMQMVGEATIEKATPHDVYRKANRGGILLRGRPILGEEQTSSNEAACAAPRELILNALAALANGKPGDPTHTSIPNYITDFTTLFGIGRVWSENRLLMRDSQRAEKAVVDDILSLDSRDERAIFALLEGYVAKRREVESKTNRLLSRYNQLLRRTPLSIVGAVDVNPLVSVLISYPHAAVIRKYQHTIQ